METPIKEKELPIEELEKLGLYKDGALTLQDGDIAALLAGRRTELRSLYNLEMDGFKISQLDAKLSLSRGENGKIGLKIHPIYNEVQAHPLLDEKETKQLLSGKLDKISKTFDDKGIERKLIIEYDEQTKEFVSYYPYQVEVPFKVNGEILNESQKKAFQNGEIVELEDGTRLRHSATDSKGVKSDAKRLIFSVLFDGGLSYLVMRGLRHLANNGDLQKEGYTKGYNQALADMMLGKPDREQDMTVGDHQAHSINSQHSRGYGRTGSR
ncbi:DUF4099 domain-containing protein [Pedobacter sp. ASV28]|uniref:DUF4099 domain-containing protein n=1 Tax=Pedobacter sp. ASV28 TaxID=2795123 RepID=UPI0018EB8DE7|nr:DUF4099 domain-containing protein [Pedobacter sp. ASV28]